MRVVVSTEQRYCRDRAGNVWTDGSMSYRFYCRYLSVFDHVRVLSRVQHAEKPSCRWCRADGKGVSFEPLPHYIGPFQYAANRARLVGMDEAMGGIGSFAEDLTWGVPDAYRRPIIVGRGVADQGVFMDLAAVEPIRVFHQNFAAV